MLDVSDGLGADAAHLARRSRVRCAIERKRARHDGAQPAGRSAETRSCCAASISSARWMRAASDTHGSLYAPRMPEATPLGTESRTSAPGHGPSCGEAVVRLLEQYDTDIVFGLEEDYVVTATGSEPLGTPQESLILIPSAPAP